MRIIDKLERKFGKYALHNLMMYIVIANIITFVLFYFDQSLQNLLYFNPALILQGEIWRIFTFVFIPPTQSFWIIFVLMFYYFMGNSLEHYWGAFKFNLYFFVGCFFTILAQIILYLITKQAYINESATYVNLSILLAFATVFPNYEIRIYFVLPLKIKWLAIIYAVGIGFSVLISPIPTKLSIIISLMNYFLFFGPDLFRKNKQQAKATIRKSAYVKEVKKSGHKHVCTVCGATDANEDLEFRFCSKCSGSHEYCSEHLFTHEHKK